MTVLAYDDPIVRFARQVRLGAAGNNAWKVALVEANIPRANLAASWKTLDPSHDPDAFAAARAYADTLGADASMSRLLGHCTVVQLTGYDRRMARMEAI